MRTWLTLLAILVVAICTALPMNAEEPAAWGTILGRVVYDGKAPVAKNLVVNKEVIPGKEPKVPDESLVVGKNGGLANVFVYLRSKPSAIHPDYVQAEPKKILFEVKDYHFVPHALGIWTHDIFDYHNREPYGVNINYDSPVEGLGALIAPEQSYERKFRVPTSLPHNISCNIHSWMQAKLLVRDNPYFYVTNERGNFCIPNLPANEELEFVFWHERVGYLKNIKSDVETFTTNDKGRVQTKLTQPVTDLGEFRIDPQFFEVAR